MNDYQLTPPAAEPVTVDEAKVSARLDGAHWDAIVTDAIKSAREVCEHETGRRLMSQAWRYELEDWPTTDSLLPELAPTAVAVSYWDGAQWQTLSTASYVWQPTGIARSYIALAPAIGATWPTLGDVALGPRVRIDVTVGAATPAAVPGVAKTFIKALVALLAADPSLTATEALAANVYLRHILDPIRLYR